MKEEIVDAAQRRTWTTTGTEQEGRNEERGTDTPTHRARSSNIPTGTAQNEETTPKEAHRPPHGGAADSATTIPRGIHAAVEELILVKLASLTARSAATRLGIPRWAARHKGAGGSRHLAVHELKFSASDATGASYDALLASPMLCRELQGQADKPKASGPSRPPSSVVGEITAFVEERRNAHRHSQSRASDETVLASSSVSSGVGIRVNSSLFPCSRRDVDRQ